MLNSAAIQRCWICKASTLDVLITLRSQKQAFLNRCHNCDFNFFSHINEELIKNDKLDVTRLESAGLKRPSIEKDWQNGYEQSKNYVSEYLTRDDVDQHILEIGCSWGYFLKTLKEFGSKPYGVELNKLRAQHVENNLGIVCKTTIDYYIENKFKFKKIFLFYCLEYIDNPINFLSSLIDLLDEKGKIFIVTPNLNDALKDVWMNKHYIDFFYDECSIGYYSINSIENLVKQLKTIHPHIIEDVSVKQGYSAFNHIFWLFNGRPYPDNKFVGNDRMLTDLFGDLKKSSCGNELFKLFDIFNEQYKKIIEQHSLGNQILVELALM